MSAEQPGKAADPRPAQPRTIPVLPVDEAADRRIDALRASQPRAESRPVQPQAPAEPWKSPEGYTLVEPLEQQAAFASGEGHMLSESELRAAAEHFREHPPEELAAAVEQLTGDVRAAAGDATDARRERDAERAKAAERDARIATLTRALEGALYENGICEKTTTNTLLPPHRGTTEEWALGAWAALSDEPRAAPSTTAPSEAPLDALREALKHVQEELRDGFIVCSSCGHEEPTGDLDVLTVYIDPALSAPPPPPREQELLGKEGADATLQVLRDARDAIGDLAPGHTVLLDDLDEQIALREATASAPPRKAPREDAQAWVKGWLAGREAAAQEAGVRFGTSVEDALFALPAPSSPEEQLSEGATTKKEG